MKGKRWSIFLEKQDEGPACSFSGKGVSQRLGGIVIDFDDQIGEGEIKLDLDGAVVTVHHKEIISTDKRKYLAVGSPVELEVETSRGEAQSEKESCNCNLILGSPWNASLS